MLLQVNNGKGRSFIEPLTVEVDNVGSISIVFAKAGGNAKLVVDISITQYENALVAAVKENKPFVDLTSKGVAAIKAKLTLR